MKRHAILMLAGGLVILLGIGWMVTEHSTRKSRIYVPGSQTDFLKSPGLSWKQIARHYTPSTGIQDWRKLQSAQRWKPGYSAYELAAAWENANPGLPPEIRALFDDSAKLLAAIPEHPTPLPGSNTASQSDVLAFIRTHGKVCAVAVEGKAGETFGPTIGEWLQGASKGKIQRLKYLSNKLGLSYPPPDHIRYQLLHRTASAMIEAEHFHADCAVMIVHSLPQNQELLEDYTKFLGLFGISNARVGKLYYGGTSKIPLSFGWASPSRGAVFKTSIATLIMLAGALLLAIGFFLRLAGNKPQAATNPDQNLETVSAKATTGTNDLTDSVQEMQNKLDKVLEKLSETKSEDVNQENGLKFEKYVVQKLDQKNYSIVAWEGDKFVDGRYAETTLEPDLKLRHTSNKQEHLFAIECKWRSRFLKSSVQLAESRQLKNYQNYQHRTGQKTFIVLGVGGRADNPESMFIIPVEDLTRSDLSKRELVPYYQTDNGNLFYDFRKGMLGLLPRETTET